jgi:hypothetical protein
LVTVGVFLELLFVTNTTTTAMIAIASATAPAIAQRLGPPAPSPGG